MEKPVPTHSIVEHYLEISILIICISGIKPDSCIQFTTIFWGYLRISKRLMPFKSSNQEWLSEIFANTCMVL